MQFIIIWLISILVTCSIEYSMKFDIHRIIFKNRYKFSNNNINATTKSELSFDANVLERVIDFIPLVNVITKLFVLTSYICHRNYIFNFLLEQNLIVNMTEEEKAFCDQYNSMLDAMVAKEELKHNKKAVIEDDLTIECIEADELMFTINNQPTKDIEEAIEVCRTPEMKDYLLSIKKELEILKEKSFDDNQEEQKVLKKEK